MIYAPQNTEAWRTLSRAERIILRETAKAMADMMIFGTGYTRQGDFDAWRRDGSDILRRVPSESVWLAMDGKGSGNV